MKTPLAINPASAGPGWDQDSGAGIVMADAALEKTLPVIKTVELIDANRNGSLDANECADLILTLLNGDGATLSGVTAVLTSSAPNILIDPDGRIARAWPRVSVEGHADDVVAEVRKRAAD